MAISFSFQKNDFVLIEPNKIKKWVSEVICRRGKQLGKISYCFCDDEYLFDINQRFLNHDTFTDIITFDYVVADLISGDIMISVDRVGENADKCGVSFEQELLRVIIHGVLHLLGQGDKSEVEALEMRCQEEAALALWKDMFLVEHVC